MHNRPAAAVPEQPIGWAADRRTLLQHAGFGLIAAGAGVGSLCTPREARAAQAPLKVLTAGEARALEAFGDALLPGAAAAGIAHFVDHHLAVDPADSLLLLRYLDWPARYPAFYKAGLAALERQAQAVHGKPPQALDTAQWGALIGSMPTGDPAAWNGIPPGLLYFVVRSDAVDVVYGTEDGFARLGLTYLPHIVPPSKW